MNSTAPLEFAETRRLLRRDRERIARMVQRKFGYRPLWLFFEPAYQAALWYRLARYFQARGWRFTARFCMQLNGWLNGCDIYPSSDIGGGLLMPAPCATTISARVGENLTMLAATGLGGSQAEKDIGAGPGLAILGDGVYLAQFVGIIRAIHISDGTRFLEGVGRMSDVLQPHTDIMLHRQPVSGEFRPPARVEPPGGDCTHSSWRATWACFREDLRNNLRMEQQLEGAPPREPSLAAQLSRAFLNQMLATALYRVSHWLYCRGWRTLAHGVAGLNRLLHKTSIHPASCIGPRLFIPHPAGLVLRCRAGSDFTAFSNAMCCENALQDGPRLSGLQACPSLGDGVAIGGHSGVFGPVSIGDSVVIAPKAQVFESVQARHNVFSTHFRSQAVPREEADHG